MMDAHCVAVAVEEAPDAAALGSSSVMSTVPASLDDEISLSRKKARLSSDPYSEGSEGATRRPSQAMRRLRHACSRSCSRCLKPVARRAPRAPQPRVPPRRQMMDESHK